MPALQWHNLLAATACAYAVFRLIRLYNDSVNLLLLISLIAGGICFGVQFAKTGGSLADYAAITCAAALLSAMANVLRLDKPVFARYPAIFTMMPFIIVIIYPLVAETLLIKHWILALFQAGSLIMAFLLLSLKISRTNLPSTYLLYWTLFAASWALHWFTDLPSAYLLAVAIVLAAGDWSARYVKQTLQPF